jgi:hypothetical protein
MLNIKKNVTLTGTTTIDGAQVAGYQAVINSEKPADMNLSSWQNDKALYKQNRTLCRQEQAEFEDAAYELQDKMIAENAEKQEETE